MENCCCFGHRDVYENIGDLPIVLENLITKEGVTNFFTGGMGNFDGKFSDTVRELKKKYNVRLILVKPYFSNELNTYKKFYEKYYDSVIIPNELAGTHYKSAIEKRNRWLVDNSDIIVAYVHREFCGAYKAIKYAELKGKKIIRL